MSSSMDHLIEHKESGQPENDTTSSDEPKPHDGEKQKQGNLFSPLRVRNFQLLFAGQTISTLGDTFYAVALP